MGEQCGTAGKVAGIGAKKAIIQDLTGNEDPERDAKTQERRRAPSAKPHVVKPIHRPQAMMAIQKLKERPPLIRAARGMAAPAPLPSS